ncbi:bacillithiol biosynthesis deacetylase BshB1 [Aquimarina aggregata]|uniref:bacillithiol biosynthesis deacetylase BshB1 n=1 Tax=Aquimarina aggregata TaxID=1642818 RepID=UPI00248FB221|nr:bacillithiol biosynthesis deacetylase BshB1 [Aquimarina aggregata]
MKLDILAVGAHPDDIELGCSGTIAKEIANGKKVGILDLTRGGLGTRGTPEIRDAEAKAAGEILNVAVRENLAFRDGFFKNDEEHQIEVIKMIRKYQPEIVLCNAIHDRHIDHGKGSKLVSDSCFLSGLRKIETIVEGQNQKAWRPKQVYHYIQWYDMKPDFIVDISGYMDVKMKSILAYRSQFYDPSSKEPSIPISSEIYKESIRYKAYDFGRIAGVQYAEAFTAERHIAVDSVFDLI